ncbi:MAG: hypothetical protein ABIT08_01900 [Bacteroidia bacterium]
MIFLKAYCFTATGKERNIGSEKNFRERFSEAVKAEFSKILINEKGFLFDKLHQNMPGENLFLFF